ncbi:MAG: DUF427 domain-containing protein [Nitrospirota bacterium]|nr:MAG: DUF427 domain-containing protein [Nitrospirota bacterium]
MKATWNGTVVAESDKTIVIEGNHYFPPDSVKWDYFEKTDHTSVCPWKGNAIYYNITVNGEKNDNAAWSYPEPKEAAKEIKGYVAFWKGVEIT